MTTLAETFIKTRKKSKGTLANAALKVDAYVSIDKDIDGATNFTFSDGSEARAKGHGPGFRIKVVENKVSKPKPATPENGVNLASAISFLKELKAENDELKSKVKYLRSIIKELNNITANHI